MEFEELAEQVMGVIPKLVFVFLILIIALILFERIINYISSKIEDRLDKGKVPIFNIELDEEQKSFILRKLKYFKNDLEVQQLIRKVKENTLNEEDIKMLNKLLKLRKKIKFFN